MNKELKEAEAERLIYVKGKNLPSKQSTYKEAQVDMPLKEDQQGQLYAQRRKKTAELDKTEH